jgi:hypothetical protein
MGFIKKEKDQKVAGSHQEIQARKTIPRVMEY